MLIGEKLVELKPREIAGMAFDLTHDNKSFYEKNQIQTNFTFGRDSTNNIMILIYKIIIKLNYHFFYKKAFFF